MKYWLSIFLKSLLFLFGFLFQFEGVVCYAQNSKVDSLSRILKNHPAQDDKRAQLLLNLSLNYLQQDPEMALAYPDEVLSFQNKLKNKVLVSDAYRAKGNIYSFLARFQEAIDAYSAGILWDETIHYNIGIAASLGNIGTAYMSQGKMSEALKYFLQALKKHESLQNELNVAITLMNIGIVHTELRDYDLAMNNYQKSLPIFQKYKHMIGQAHTLTNMAVLQMKKKNLSEAVRYSKSALQIGDSINNMRIRSRENGNLSAYYAQLKQPDLALEYGSKAIELNEILKNPKGLGLNYQNYSDAYFQKNDYVKAKSYAFKALKIAKELDLVDLKRDANLGLSEVYTALNKPDSAFFHYKLYKETGDSISSDEKKNEITRMSIQHEFDKTEAVYKQKQTLAEGQLKQQQLQIALNNAELQKGIQQRDLQNALLENEKLVSEEKQKQLQISKNNEKLQLSKLNALSQEQKLSQLEIQQLWLYGILAIVCLASVLIYLLNHARIRRLKFANILQLQEAEQNTLKMEYQYQLSESELRAIRSQMNPHFIFNVLNSIESYIMDNDKRVASRLIQKFASLSRLILENSIKSLVSADKEWKALQLYTELEAMRYNNSFTYSFKQDENLSLNTILLPPMLIQPLIENAILHGIVGSGIQDGHISVTMQLLDKVLIITVIDNGVGLHGNTRKMAVNSTKEKSIGLKSIRERIKLINDRYHTSANFTIEEREGERGTVAVISLPVLTTATAEMDAV